MVFNGSSFRLWDHCRGRLTDGSECIILELQRDGSSPHQGVADSPGATPEMMLDCQYSSPFRVLCVVGDLMQQVNDGHHPDVMLLSKICRSAAKMCACVFRLVGGRLSSRSKIWVSIDLRSSTRRRYASKRPCNAAPFPDLSVFALVSPLSCLPLYRARSVSLNYVCGIVPVVLIMAFCRWLDVLLTDGERHHPTGRSSHIAPF